MNCKTGNWFVAGRQSHMLLTEHYLIELITSNYEVINSI